MGARHRLLSQMMRISGPAPPAIAYDHLWRMIDAVGSTAPDSIGTADLELSADCVIEAEGTRVTLNTGFQRTPVSGLAFDPTRASPGFSIVVEARLNGWGLNGDVGRLISCMPQVMHYTIEGWIRSGAGNNFSYRDIPESTSNTSINVTFTLNDVILAGLVRQIGQRDRYYLYRNGVFAGQSTIGDDACRASSGADYLYFSNRRMSERAWEGPIRWAGAIDAELSREQMDEIAAYGRPPAP